MSGRRAVARCAWIYRRGRRAEFGRVTGDGIRVAHCAAHERFGRILAMCGGGVCVPDTLAVFGQMSVSAAAHRVVSRDRISCTVHSGAAELPAAGVAQGFAQPSRVNLGGGQVRCCAIGARRSLRFHGSRLTAQPKPADSRAFRPMVPRAPAFGHHGVGAPMHQCFVVRPTRAPVPLVLDTALCKRRQAPCIGAWRATTPLHQ
ncbi:hypothetical protein FGB62_55g063 [Gracilaria domingensis]|nr:hypothetical protein FGB62_55g063 [Gracilaria domingensis]